MHIQFKQLFLVPVTTFFCTIAFSSPLIDAGQGVSLQAGNTPWSDVGSESVTQQPLLIAKWEYHKRVYYCQVREGEYGIKYRTKHAHNVYRAEKKIERCNNNGSSCILGKCEDVHSYS